MTERENALHALRNDGKTQWVPCFSKAIQILFPPIIEDKKAEGIDWFGVKWKEEVPVTHLLSDLTDWQKHIKFPDLDAIDWEGCAAEILPTLDRENKVIFAMMSVGLFERMHTILSFEDALTCFYDQPEETKELLTCLADFRYRLTEKVIQYFDPDVINYRDDYGTQLNTFFSPDIFRKFFKPHIKRLADQAHAHGKIFALHSCGKVDSLIGDFIEAGADVWDSVQPCCDLPAIYEKYGRLISFEPVPDLQRFQFCSEEEAREVIRNLIDTLGANGNLIIWDILPLKLPIDDSVLTDEIERYGRDYYIRNPIKRP